MNLSEFFFFKTVQCTRKEAHDLDACYYFHLYNRGVRRCLVDLTSCTTVDYNERVDKKTLRLYSNQVGFEKDLLNEMIFANVAPCRNATEVRYHILNYKTSGCYFEASGVKCVYGKLCPDLHYGEAIDSDIFYFKLLFEKLLFSTELFVLGAEIILLRNKIISFNVIHHSHHPNNHNQNYSNYVSKIESPSTFKKESTNTVKKSKTNRREDVSPCSSKKEDELNLSTSIKKYIYVELKNIPVLSRGDLFSKLINTDDQITFLSNSTPKKDDLNKLLIAFLNSHNGIILFGADVNSSKLTGVKMDRKARDLFKQTFNTEYKDYLVEYEGCIKYKFYDLEDNNSPSNLPFKIDNFCIVAIKVKKVKDNKLLFDPYNKSFIIKDKFLKRFKDNSSEPIKLSDIKQLNMKEYIEITRNKLLSHFNNK